MVYFVGLVKQKIVIENFNCKPGFGMFYTTDGHIAFSSGWSQPLDGDPEDKCEIYIYVKDDDGHYIGNWHRVNKDVVEFLHQQYNFYINQAFNEACEKAAKIYSTRLAPALRIDLTDTVPGNKSSNGGEYGFYSHYEPTDVPGVFWTWTTTTCDFDRCGTTGYDGGHYEVLTKKRMRRLLQISDRIEEEGNLYNPSYDEDYYE